MFLWNFLAFSMIQQMLVIWSLVPLPFLNPACTSGSSQFTYCWSIVWRILSITLLAYEMSAIVQWFEHSLVLLFFGTGMKTDLFQSCGHCCFPNLLTNWEQHFNTIIFRTWNSSATIPSPPLVFCSQYCFLRPTWLHIPGCLALGEWPHHHGYLGH